jgi:hypothetical protein
VGTPGPGLGTVAIVSIAAAACGRVGFDEIEPVADCAVEPSAQRCFALSLAPATWGEARAACAAMGPTTHLATIADPDENAAAAAFAARIPFDPQIDTNTNQRQRMWLGANDLETTGTYQWITGEPFDYVNWRIGEPGSPGVEHCAILLGSEDGLWDDRPCTSTYEWLCERD